MQIVNTSHFLISFCCYIFLLRTCRSRKLEISDCNVALLFSNTCPLVQYSLYHFVSLSTNPYFFAHSIVITINALLCRVIYSLLVIISHQQEGHWTHHTVDILPIWASTPATFHALVAVLVAILIPVLVPLILHYSL